MSENQELDRAVADFDVDAARIAIRLISREDMHREVPQALSLADEACRVFKEKGIDFFEEDDGRFVMPPESEWSEDLLYTIRGGLDWNFSRKRLECLQNLTVFLARQKRQASAEAPTSGGLAYRSETRDGACSWVKWAAVGAVAALVVGCLVVKCITKGN